MAGDDDIEDTNHLETASETILSGFANLILGAHHVMLGVSEWTKDQHIAVQSVITGGIFLIFIQLLDQIWQLFFQPIWGQAVYASGIRLRLLPIPLSIVIYVLILSITYMYVYVRNLQTEVRSLESRLKEVEGGQISATQRVDDRE